MSYMGRSELIAAVKKNKTALKPHSFLVIKKNTIIPIIFLFYGPVSSEEFLLYAVSSLKTKYIGNKK